MLLLHTWLPKSSQRYLIYGYLLVVLSMKGTKIRNYLFYHLADVTTFFLINIVTGLLLLHIPF